MNCLFKLNTRKLTKHFFNLNYTQEIFFHIRFVFAPFFLKMRARSQRKALICGDALGGRSLSRNRLRDYFRLLDEIDNFI